VTDTNDGSRPRSSASAVRRFSSPVSVLGGKNSKENVGPDEARRSMRIRGLCSPALGLAGDAADRHWCPFLRPETAAASRVIGSRAVINGTAESSPLVTPFSAPLGAPAPQPSLLGTSATGAMRRTRPR
jgi:hypothetical protein